MKLANHNERKRAEKEELASSVHYQEILELD